MENLVFNRYRADSIGGRILTALTTAPRTPAELARIAKSRSADNILAPGGWYSQLRRFGKESGKFTLEVKDNRLVLTVTRPKSGKKVAR